VPPYPKLFFFFRCTLFFFRCTKNDETSTRGI
jgi:hypothetical protein